MIYPFLIEIIEKEKIDPKTVTESVLEIYRI